MRSLTFALCLLGLSSLAACGSDDVSSGDDVVEPDADPTVPPDADLSEFTELIGRDWTIPAGQEDYRCIGIRVPEDAYISVFHAGGVSGEHHQVLTVAQNPGGFTNTQLGEDDNCEVTTLNLQMLFASGVGTDDLQFPDGVAIKVTQGQFLHLNLHLFNTNPSAPLSGHSGIYIKTIPQSEVTDEAEMIFAGDMDLAIPGNTGTTTPHMESGGCTFTRAGTIVAYWPHMHQHGVHQKVTFTPSGGSAMTLHDEPFDFNEQLNFPLDTPLVVGNGDSLLVECSYFNNTGMTVDWGDSSTQEMCFTGLYRYPKQAATLFDCTDGAF